MKKIFIVLLFVLIPVAIITAATTTYKVKKGDTLRGIANKYGITLEKLLSLNPKLLKEGTVLNVPDAQSQSAGTETNGTNNSPTPTVPLPTTFYPFESRMIAFITGYTYWDNTPPGSADISNPVLHQKAGGTGTYDDPITVAVGHSIIKGEDILDYPEGTKFYIPNLRRYFIVEDTCGDGDTPQNGPCHKGFPKNTTTWLDVWIDGGSGSRSSSNSCAEAITGSHLVIKNPASVYAVISGSVFGSGACSKTYGDALLLN